MSVLLLTVAALFMPSLFFRYFGDWVLRIIPVLTASLNMPLIMAVSPVVSFVGGSGASGSFPYMMSASAACKDMLHVSDRFIFNI